jgi:hypothetical protein
VPAAITPHVAGFSVAATLGLDSTCQMSRALLRQDRTDRFARRLHLEVRPAACYLPGGLLESFFKDPIAALN